MLVLFGHAPNSATSNCAGLIPGAGLNGGMPAFYAIGTGMEYGHRGGVVPHHFVRNQGPIIDVSSKLGAPLKQTSTPKHSSNSVSSGSTASPRRAQPMAKHTRYKTERCRTYSEWGYCDYKEKCQYAHGDAEVRQLPRHPKHKTELCRNFHSTGLCNYGERCDFIHNERPASIPTPQPQSPTLWQAGPANNRLFTTAASWASPPPVGVCGLTFGQSAPIAPTAVAPLTIPALTEVIGQPGVPYLYQAPAFCALGSVCSSNQSCTSGADSPPPSSSSCEQSPVSFSPDLATNGSTFDHYYYTPPPPQQSPLTVFQSRQLMINGAVELLAPKFGPVSDSGTASARRVFTFSTDSTATADGAESNASTQHSDALDVFSPNPHQPTDLDQYLANLSLLEICRLDSLGNAVCDGDAIAGRVFGLGEQQQPIGDLSMTSKSDPSIAAYRRLPTFTWLTQGDRRETENGDYGEIASWVSNERKCVF